MSLNPSRAALSARLGPKPARHALSNSAANPPAERRPSELFSYLVRQEGKRIQTGRACQGPTSRRARGGAGAARPRGRETWENERGPPPARPAPAAAFTVPDAAQQTAATEAERAPPPSSPPADPPHLDLPTPLSPMIRIFRVVSTSSSILTLLRSEPSWPPRSGSQPFTGEIVRACAPLSVCHLPFSPGV